MEKVLVGIVLIAFLVASSIASASFTAQVSADAGNINLFQTSYKSSDTMNTKLFNNSSTIHNELTSTSAVLTLGRSAMQKSIATMTGLTGSTLLTTSGSANAFDRASLLNSAVQNGNLCDTDPPTVSEKQVDGIIGVMGAGKDGNSLVYASNTKAEGTSASVSGSAVLPHNSDVLYGRMTSNEITNLSRNSNLFTIIVHGNASAYANNSSTTEILLGDE